MRPSGIERETRDPPTRRQSGTLWTLLAVSVLAALAGPILYDAVHVRSVQERAGDIPVGATRETVAALLGTPVAKYARGSGLLDGALFGIFPMTPEQWAYGSWFKWDHCIERDFPWFQPFRERWFGPDSDDVRIEFDRKGKVMRVLLPGQ